MNDRPASCDMTDQRLVVAFADSGDRRAFEMLVRRYASMVFRVCSGVLRQHHDAEDAAQATFIVLARQAAALRSRDNIAGWLHWVAWHVSTRQREAAVVRARHERSLLPQPAAMPAGDPAERAQQVHRAIAELPEKYRIPFVLRHLEDHGEEEIAALLDCKTGTVSARLSRARQIIRKRLAALGAAPIVLANPVDQVRFETAGDFAMENISRELAARAAGGAASARALALASGAARAVSWRSRPLLLLAGVAAVVIAPIVTYVAARNPHAPLPRRVPPGMVVGLVSDPQGNAVSGASLSLFLSRQDFDARRPPLARVTSDRDGMFRFSDQPTSKTYFVSCDITGDADRGFQTRMRASALIDAEIHVR